MARITPKGGKYSVGGKYEDGYMKASIRELGNLHCCHRYHSRRRLSLSTRISGEETERLSIVERSGAGIASYRGTIDGKYALFGRSQYCEIILGMYVGPQTRKEREASILLNLQ